MSLTDQVSVLKRRDGEVIGYAEFDRDGFRASADQRDSGEAHGHISGETRQGDTGTLLTARILVRALSAAGATWDTVAPYAELVDRDSICASDHQYHLLIQGARATTSAEYWPSLSTNGAAARTQSAELLAEQLSEAIRQKTARYLPSVRANPVLALNASRLPGFIMSRVRGIAADLTRAARATVGYSDVWVVGPRPELAFGLGC